MSEKRGGLYVFLESFGPVGMSREGAGRHYYRGSKSTEGAEGDLLWRQ